MFDSRYVDQGNRITEYDVQEESKVLDTLESLPNYSLYLSDTNKKNVEYGFWTRSAISWSLECEETHSRDSVVEAALFEKEKAPLNETGVIVVSAIAYGLGFLVTAVFFMCFAIGKCSRSKIHEISIMAGCGLGCQFILFAIATGLVFSQKGELSERDEAMKSLTFVNGCGDKYTTIPDNFLPELEEASGKIVYVITATIIQVILALATLLACVLGGKSHGDDNDREEQDYEKVPEMDEEE